MRNAERPPRSNYRCGASESSIQLVGIKGSDPFISLCAQANHVDYARNVVEAFVLLKLRPEGIEANVNRSPRQTAG
jgi:hypothetical protein